MMSNNVLHEQESSGSSRDSGYYSYLSAGGPNSPPCGFTNDIPSRNSSATISDLCKLQTDTLSLSSFQCLHVEINSLPSDSNAQMNFLNNLKRLYQLSECSSGLLSSVPDFDPLFLSGNERDISFLGLNQLLMSPKLSTNRVTIHRIEKEKKVLEILNVISYFSSENIPIKMFVDLAGGTEELESAVELLKQYSVVNLLQQDATMLNISKQTQQVIRAILKKENKEEVTLRKALQLFQIGLESGSLDHAVYTWHYVSAYENLFREFHILPSNIVQKLDDCGRYEEAYSFGMEQLIVMEKLDVGRSLYLRYKIGNVFLKQRKFEEALRIYENSTNLYKGVNIFLCYAAEDGYLEATKFLIENKGTNDRLCYGKTLIHYAVLSNNLEVVKFLVEEKGELFNIANLYGVTPIQYASEKGNLDIVKFLVDKGVDFNSTDNFRRTSVHYAAKQSNPSIIKFFVERGADFRSHDDDLGTPLHSAAKNGGLDVVKFLVEKGADVNSAGRGDKTPLHRAAREGGLDVVKFLIEKGADVNSSDIGGRTTLHRAAKNDALDVVKFLVEKGADVNSADGKGAAPLHYAAEKGGLDLVKFLVEKGADFNSIDNVCQTSVHYAAKQSNPGIIKFLVERGVDFKSCNDDLKTPLHFGVEKGGLDVVKFLVEKGADVNSADRYGIAPLHKATGKGDLDVLKFLVEKGADVNSADESGRTPLHWATYMGKVSAVRILIKKGASVVAIDENRMTPLGYAFKKLDPFEPIDDRGGTQLHYAVHFGNVQLVQNLLKRVSDDKLKVFILHRTKEGTTALDLALKAANENIIKILDQALQKEHYQLA